MANLSNCGLCGSRERPEDLSLLGGRYICPDCEEGLPEGLGFDDLFRYVQSFPVAEPLNIHGTGPLSAALRADDPFR